MSAATSPGLSFREAPARRSPSSSGPNAIRSSVLTGCPTCSSIRFTCRLRPWWIVSSHRVRSRPADAGRGPSSPRSSGYDSGAEQPGERAVEQDTAGRREHRPDRSSGHLEARVREPMRELAVVGQQDQPGRVDVEAADRVQAQVRGRSSETTVGRRWGSRAVLTTPARLVDRVHDPLGRVRARPAFRRASRCRRLRRRARDRGRGSPAIRTCPARADDLLGGAARGYAGERRGYFASRIAMPP